VQIVTSRLVGAAAAGCLLAAAPLAAAGVAGGDTEDEPPAIGETIVVTARYRAEDVQDVPISMTALPARTLDDAAVGRAGEFVALVPNVSISEAQSVGYSALTIRGLSQVRNGEPPVATVVDGVLQVSPNQFTRELFDIERIEVLRGPQGALYGRNASGGAILITTRAPDAQLGSRLRLGVGRSDERLLQASLSGPLGDERLGFRIGARHHAHDGYLDNITLGRHADPYRDTSLSTLLRLRASDALSVDLRANFSRSEGGALNYRFQPANLAADGRSLDLSDPFDFSRADADQVERTLIANNLGENRRDIDELSLKLDYILGATTFSAITAWSRVEEYVAGDQFPYTALALPASQFFIDGTQTQFLDVEAFSQELRWVSAPELRLRWMVGGYYLHTERFISTSTGDDLGLGIEPIRRRPAFDSARNPTATFFADDNRNRAWALFGNLAYDLTDTVELAFALRHDHDRRRQRVSPQQAGGGQPGALNRASFEHLQPKLTLRYQPLAPVMWYAAWGEGFRSGQFNQNGVGAAAARAGLSGIEDRVAAEVSRTAELGFKSALFDSRLQLNGSLFRTALDNTAYFVFVGAVGAQVLVNIDEVRISGGELEAQWRLSDGLDLYAGLGRSDSRIESYRLNPAAVGNHAPYVPATSINAGLQYRAALGGPLRAVARIDYERRGRQYWDPENSSARSAIDLVNLRAGVEQRDGRWSLMATVRNATDTRYNAEWVLGGFAHAGLPRTWQLELQREF
jgi:iron complex outermembrane recepter protein